MRVDVNILSVNHYQMDGNQGLSVRVVGDKVETSNKFGLEISEATVTDYNELKYLERFSNQLPAKFKADFSLTNIKDKNGKEKTGVAFRNLEYVHSIEFVEKKSTVKV